MTFFAAVKVPVDEIKVKHYEGLPHDPNRVLLPRPHLVLLKQTPEGIFLYRYTASGIEVGDTWHQTLDEAHGQADYEYGELTWKKVPEGIVSEVDYALSQIGAEGDT